MTLTELFSRLSSKHITLWVENNNLRFHAPKGALTEELRKLITDNKTEIIAYLNEKSNQSGFQNQIDQIAVIGLDCRFPGANNSAQFWENLKNGIESIHHFTDAELDNLGISPDIYNAPNYVKAASIIDDIDMFDAAFFGYSPRDAEIIDPQQRLFLECAWNALENAGYDSGSYQGKIGVFGGSGPNYYGRAYSARANNISEVYQYELGNESDYLTTRIAYKLGLKGPAFTVQTACSTSLVAAHIACQNLLAGQCDMALAGGVCVNVRTEGGYFYEQGLIPSPDGHCRAFDAEAQGTIGGQGAGVILLKRLSDAIADRDNIFAIIRGSAINNDGDAKVGFTAPSIKGQSEVIIEALKSAGVSPEEIGYIEAHGTGTPLGDPIEIKALTKAFRTSTENCGYCPIGSVKTNIGHLDAAAGIAGLIKAILVLQHKQIPPTLHFKEPNPNIDFENSPFFVINKLTNWENTGFPRRAGVSAFGIGGTNAHMILEEPPVFSGTGSSHRLLHPLVFSAKTKEALNNITSNMAAHLESNPGLNPADVAYTLQVGRKAFNHRATVICSDLNDAIEALRAVPSRRIISEYCEAGHRDVVFMFSGQGSQYVNMGLGLYREEPFFREQIDYCSDILKQEMSVDIRSLLYPSVTEVYETEEKLAQTAITQPILFVIEYALARLWMSWGIQPGAFVGHSIGEYTAACLAGVFTLEEALKLVAARGRLMQEMPKGSMLTVFLTEEQISKYINDDLNVSVINNPGICVVSGEDSRIDALEKLLSEKQIMCRKLHTSHAFHSGMMDPMLEPFTEIVRGVELKQPKIPFLSNVTGTWIKNEEAIDPVYWAKQLRGTVRFSDCLNELLKEQNNVLLEAGPGTALTALASQHPSKMKNHVILSSMRHPKNIQNDNNYILDTLCALWRSGVAVDWMAYNSGAKARRVQLPTYPFERKRYWLNSIDNSTITGAGFPKTKTAKYTSFENSFSNDKVKKTETVKYNLNSKEDVEKILTDIWEEILGVHNITNSDDFFALGGHSLVAIRLFTRIEECFGKRLPLSTLLSSPTIEQLAELIVKDDFTPSWKSLVKIHMEGNKKPLYLIHSEGGNVLEYYKLVEYLNKERPFYGLQAVGLEGKEIVFLSIEDMARHYITEIKETQPQGPYLIAGFCLGGLIAAEMTKQMEANGDRIAFLGMINTYEPSYLNRDVHRINKIQKIIYKLLERIELEIDNLSVLDLKEKISYMADRFRQIGLICRISYEDFMQTAAGIIHLKKYHHSRRYILEKIRQAQSKAFFEYKPSLVKSKITLFRVSRQPRSLIRDEALGWSNYSENGVVSFEIPAFHKNIMKEPNVKTLADKMQECLNGI